MPCETCLATGSRSGSKVTLTSTSIRERVSLDVPHSAYNDTQFPSFEVETMCYHPLCLIRYFRLFPLSVRSLGSALATSTNWGCNFLVGLTVS